MSEQEYLMIPASEARKVSQNIGAVILWRPLNIKRNWRKPDEDPCELRSVGDASLVAKRVRQL